mgnify:FL=1
MFETLKSAFRVKEMRRKLLYLLAMIFVIRIGSQLPIGWWMAAYSNSGSRAIPVMHSISLMHSPVVPLKACLFLR